MADLIKPIAQMMVDLGFIDVILPFMFVFTIVFAMLQKTKVLGTYSKNNPKANFNALIAFVVAFFFIASLARVQVLTTIVQRLALIVVAAICILLITAFWGTDVSFKGFKWLYPILFIVLLVIFGTALGWFGLEDLNIIALWFFHPITAFAFVFILVLWFIIREPGKKSSRPKQESQRPESPRPEQPPSKQSEQKGESKQPDQEGEQKPGQPRLVRRIPKEDLYGGDDKVLWKE